MPGFALALASLVDALFSPDPSAVLAAGRKWALVFMGIGLASVALSMVQGCCFAVMGERLSRRVRAVLLGAMMRQEMAWFDKPKNTSRALCACLRCVHVCVEGGLEGGGR